MVEAQGKLELSGRGHGLKNLVRLVHLVHLVWLVGLPQTHTDGRRLIHYFFLSFWNFKKLMIAFLKWLKSSRFLLKIVMTMAGSILS